MRIEYELKFRDYLLFNIAHYWLSIPVQVLYGGMAVFVNLAHNGKSFSMNVTGAILGYFILWALHILLSVFYLSFGKNRSLFTRHIVEVHDDAFYVETKFGRSYHFWLGLAKVVNRPGFIAVYINAQAAHIIPARAFASPKHKQAFLLALREKLNGVNTTRVSDPTN